MSSPRVMVTSGGAVMPIRTAPVDVLTTVNKTSLPTKICSPTFLLRISIFGNHRCKYKGHEYTCDFINGAMEMQVNSDLSRLLEPVSRVLVDD